MPDTLEKKIFYRSLTLDRAGADDEAKTVPAALSSEVEIKRWFGIEVLSHEPGDGGCHQPD